MNQNSNGPPVARLIGVTETPGEGCACSLVFELESESGQRLTLTYGHVMQALRFAQQQAVMAPLSEHWWARVEKYDGCAF